MSDNEIHIENDRTGFRVRVTWLGMVLGLTALGSMGLFVHTMWSDQRNDDRYASAESIHKIESDVTAIRFELKEIGKAVK